MSRTTGRIRVAVIGLGVGEQHIGGYGSHPDCEVVAICDQDRKKLAEVAVRHPGVRRTETDAHALIDDPAIDVVSIATYDEFHAPQVIRALKKGKHVFVEKPLALSFKDTGEVFRQWRLKRGRQVLSSNLILRRYPRFAELKARISRGDLGALYMMTGAYEYGRFEKIATGWRSRTRNYSVTLGGGIHLVDLMMWLSAKRILRVTSLGNRIVSRSTPGTRFRGPDLVSSLLEFQGDAVGQITSNFGCVHPHFHSLEAFGTRATFKNALEAGYWFRSRDPHQAPEMIPGLASGVDKGIGLRAFVDRIVRGKKSDLGAVTEKEVFDTLSVCFAIDEAQQSGKTVLVKYWG